MTVNGTMGSTGAVQPHGTDAVPGASPALQLANARTAVAVRHTPRTTGGEKTVRVAHRLRNLENRFMEDIVVISL